MRAATARWVVVVLLSPVLASSSAGRFEFSEPHMGTTARVVLYARDENTARDAAAAAFSRIAQLDARLSDYRDASELMALCRRAGGPPVGVSRDLFTVLSAAQAFAARTGGAFDVTIGPVTHLWRRARAAGELPDPARLAEAERLVGYRKMRLSALRHSVALQDPGMLLDLGGIAKGYAAGEALGTLRVRGVRQALVALGGDIAAGDAPPAKAGWEVGVAPFGPQDARSYPPLTLQRAAVSTSGDAEQHLDANGTRYSHIVDPATGSARTGARAVTVIARDPMTADALATSVKLLGAARGLPLVEQTAGAAALLVEDTAAGRREYKTSRWKR
jgi:thiamine biosynthesis lipoprotein